MNNGYNETNGLDQSVLDAYNKLGGYGLELFIKGQAKQNSDEIKAPTLDDKVKEWREEAINAGYNTDQAIADYIAMKEMEYTKQQSKPGEELKQMQNLDQFSKAHESLNNYIKYSKGRLWKNYRFNRGGIDIDNEKLKRGDSYNFSKFSESNFRNQIKTLAQQLRQGKVNAFMWRGVLSRLMSHPEAFQNLLYEYKDGSGKGCYIIPGTEDMDSESVITYTTTGGLAIKSIHDFPELYANKFNNKFRELYKQQYSFDLPEDWDIQLGTAIASAKEQSDTQVQQNKNGGILKAQDGTAFTRARMSQSGSFDLENNYWNQVHQLDAQKKQLEIDEANQQGVTIEELRKRKAEEQQIQKAREEKIFSSKGELSGSDIARIAALGQDVAALVTSFEPVYGTAASGILGVTSALTDLGADVFDKSVTQGQMWTNLGINLGLAGLGMLPGGKSGSIATKIAKWSPRIIAGLAAYNVAPKVISAFKKGQEKGFQNLSRDEWKDIYYGLKIITQGGAGAVRGNRARWQKNNLYAEVTPETAGTIKSSTGRNISLSKQHIEALKGKTNQQAVEYLRGINGKDGKPLLGENEGLAQGFGSKIASKASFGKLGKQFQITENNGTVRVKTPEEVAAEFDGKLPYRYLDFIMRNPDVVPAEQFDAIMVAAGRNPKTARTLIKLGQFNFFPAIERFFNKNKFSFTGKTKGIKSPFNKTSGKQLAAVEGQGVKTVSQVNAAELRAQNRARRAAAQPVKFPEYTPPMKALPVTSMGEFQESVMTGLNREYPLGLPTSRFTPGKPIPKHSLQLAQRNISSGYTIKKLTGKSAKTYRQQVEEGLKNGHVIVVDRKGNVSIATNDTKLQRIDPSTQVTVKVRGKDVEMPISEAMAKGYQVKYNKLGGFINRVLMKLQEGGSIPKYATGNLIGTIYNNGQGTDWYNTVGSQYENDLFTALENESDPVKRQELVDYINQMQDQHYGFYKQYNGSQAYYNPEVGKYQQSIIDKNPYVNQKGIINGRSKGRYSDPKIRSVGTDYDSNHNFAADSYYGGQTDDRRLLGRMTTTYDDVSKQDKHVNDYTDEQILAINNRLKKSNLEMYLDPNTNYYKLRSLNSNSGQNPSQNDGVTITDSVTGEVLQQQPDGTFKAVGNSSIQNKSQVQKIGEDVWKYLQNINPADAIALGRALWGEHVNNKASDLYKQMGTALLDPQHQSAILHGNYTAKMLGQQLAGKIMAAGAKPISSDAGLQQASNLEAAMKAQQVLQQYNAEDSEMYWKTLQHLNEVNNENAAQEVAVGNENRGRVVAAANNRLQVEAARLAANFEQIWNPYLSGIEQNYRNEDTLRRQAEIDSWKYAVTDKYQQMNDEVMERYRTARQAAIENWKNTHTITNSDGTKSVNWEGFDEYWATDPNGSRKYQKEISDISRAMHKELYEGLSGYYTNTPFLLKRAPETTQIWRTPGINPSIHHIAANKQGGSLSAADRQALKTTTEINKNIRVANRETFANIRQDKREHRKALALVSQLSADLIKKAIGI